MAAIGGDLSSPFSGIKSRSRYELENLSIAVIDTFPPWPQRSAPYSAAVLPALLAVNCCPAVISSSNAIIRLASLDFLPRQRQRYRRDHVSNTSLWTAARSPFSPSLHPPESGSGRAARPPWRESCQGQVGTGCVVR